MTKLSFDSLSVEVTRRCNMRCEHCLRGEAENRDIRPEVLTELFKHTSSIGGLCFTGGEPSLNCAAIRQALTACRANNTFVDSFFVATNGKENMEDLCGTMLSWYSYVVEQGGDEEVCSLSLSRDVFHEEIPLKSLSLLRGLSFFNAEDKHVDFSRVPLISEGRSKTLPSEKYLLRPLPPTYADVWYEAESDVLNIRDATFYITVDGDILDTCDCSYEHQGERLVGNVFELDKFIGKLMKEAA